MDTITGYNTGGGPNRPGRRLRSNRRGSPPIVPWVVSRNEVKWNVGHGSCPTGPIITSPTGRITTLANKMEGPRGTEADCEASGEAPLDTSPTGAIITSPTGAIITSPTGAIMFFQLKVRLNIHYFPSNGQKTEPFPILLFIKWSIIRRKTLCFFQLKARLNIYIS